MVEFLKDITGKNIGFKYEKGKRYISMDDAVKDKILVLQPNSPKDKNLWTSFPKSDEGIIYRTLNNGEMTFTEMIEENKVLQR